jgi:hypothetical protein
MNHTQRLMRQTSARQFVATLGGRFHVALLVCAGLYLALLLTARLLGLIPDRFTPLTLAAVPAAAVLVALLLARRPSAKSTARLIDTRTGGKDLFLTAAMIAEAPGEFAPIVVGQAEEKAEKLRAAQVVPLRWQRGGRDLFAALAILFLAVHFLPQLDPFKKTEQRKKTAQLEEKLEQTKKTTALRSAQLAAEAGCQSEQVKLALQQLDKVFREAKPQDREANLKKLGEEQKEIGELWRKVTSDLKPLDKAAQSFGAADLQKMQQLRDELKKGDVSGLKKELGDLREALRKLAAMPEGAEKRAAQEKLMQQLNDLAQAMKQEMNSPQVAAALERAMQQLDMAKLGELSKDAAQAAQESLQLGEEELKQIGQAVQDGKALEEALKNLQMAKQLAQQDKLDGAEAKGANGMAEFEKLFREKMAALGEGKAGQAGEANGGPALGPGIGDGSKRPEDETAKTGFKTEKSNSQLTGGKMLLEWKTKEVGDTGSRAAEYRDNVQRVKQGVSEAIQQEQVPPGYHEAIKKYFDTLPEKPAEKSAK